MGRWFLSYNSQDLGLVDGIAARLKSVPGIEVFFAPQSLRVGGFWLPALAEASPGRARSSSSSARRGSDPGNSSSTPRPSVGT